jgi:hypothetical protein
MGRIRKLIGLPSYQRRLLFKAALLLAMVRLALWILPFPGGRRLLDQASCRSSRLAVDPAPVCDLAWAVKVASRFVPGAGHCLTKAHAAHILLKRRGYPAEVRFGAVRKTDRNFIAHAWLECEGVVVVGGEDLNCYARLTPRPEIHE